MGKVKQQSMVMLVQVTMQTYVKGSRGSGKVIDGITYARRKVTAAKVMVKVAVNYRRSMIKKSKYIQPIDGERSIWSQSQHRKYGDTVRSKFQV